MDRRAPARLALNEQQALVGHDDAVADGQAQPRAPAEGAKEGVEDLGQRLGGNAAAVVGQGEVPAGLPIQPFLDGRQDDAGPFSFLQGPDGVLE